MKLYLMEIDEMIAYGNGESYEYGGQWEERFDSEDERQARLDDLIPSGGEIYYSPNYDDLTNRELDIHDDEGIWIFTVRLKEKEVGA